MNTQRHAAPRARAVLTLRGAVVAACAVLTALPVLAAPDAAAAASAQAAAPAHGAAAAAATFAKVGDIVITHQEFDAAFALAARNKFYHGTPPQGEVARLQREVGQGLVDEILLAREAKRRNIRPDDAAVQQTIAGYDERYKGSAQWQANRPKVLPGLIDKLQRDNVQEQLQKQVKTVAEPTEAQLEAYYKSHADKFTSPEQVHLQLILLKVDPSSPQAKWEAAREEGAAIERRLRAGADFAELAKIHSNDPSAAKGGDLGYVHRGMLPDSVEAAVDKLKPGELSPPVQMLEGIALVRLQGRKPPVVNSMESVRPRLRDLYLRDGGEAAWNALLAKLRADNPVKFDESRFLPLAQAGENAAAR